MSRGIGDIPLTGLRYKSISQTETDDEHLHEAFLAQIQKKIRKKDEEKFGEELYVTFSVYYKYNKKVYKQIASAIICKNIFGTKDNDCRNRTYFFFSRLDPVTIANVLVDDIARFEPIVRRCVWDE